MSNFNDFGTRLKNLRKENNLTQKELAAKVFVTPSYISKLEKNAEYPSPKLVALLAMELNVSTSYLWDGLKDDKPALMKETNLIIDTYAKTNEVTEIFLEFMNIMEKCANVTSSDYRNYCVHVLSGYFSQFLVYLRELEENESNQSDNEVYRISYLMSKNFQDLVDNIKEMYIERNNSSDK